MGSRNKSYKCTFVPRGHLHGVSLSPNFHMFNDLQRPPMASEVGSDVIRSPICGVKEQKLLVHFCSQKPPSWCLIEPKFSHVERPPAASNGLGGQTSCNTTPHLWGQGTKVICALLFPEATFMVFLLGRRRTRRPLAIHRPAWDAGKNSIFGPFEAEKCFCPAAA